MELQQKYNCDRYNYDYYVPKHSVIRYNDDKRNISASIDSSHIACIGAGVLIGAAVGIYLYKKYCK